MSHNPCNVSCWSSFPSKRILCPYRDGVCAFVFFSCVQWFNWMDFFRHHTITTTGLLSCRRHLSSSPNNHTRATGSVFRSIQTSKMIPFFSFSSGWGYNQAIVILEGAASGTDRGKVISRTPLAIVALISSF